MVGQGPQGRDQRRPGGMASGADRDEQRQLGRSLRQSAEDPERVVVGPLHVVEHEGQWRSRGGAVDETEHGVEHTEAHVAGQRETRVVQLVLAGQQTADLGGIGIVAVRTKAERLGDGAERPALTQLVAPTRSQLESLRLGSRREVGEEAGLADSGIAADDDHGPSARGTRRRRPRPGARVRAPGRVDRQALPRGRA